MSLSDASEAALLDLLFTNANWGNVGDTTGLRGASTAGSYYIALHTADPTDAGTQASSEATYTSYARVAVTRAGGSWTRTGTSPTQISNAAIVNFPTCTGGSNTVTHFSVGVASSGATAIICSGPLGASQSVVNGTTPSFAIGTLIVTVD